MRGLLAISVASIAGNVAIAVDVAWSIETIDEVKQQLASGAKVISVQSKDAGELVGDYSAFLQSGDQLLQCSIFDKAMEMEHFGKEELVKSLCFSLTSK